MIEIDPNRFYTVAIWAFSIMAISNLALLIQLFTTLHTFEIISRSASVAFNFALVGFFIYLKKQMPPKITNPINSDDEVIKMMGGGFKPKK